MICQTKLAYNRVLKCPDIVTASIGQGEVTHSFSIRFARCRTRGAICLAILQFWLVSGLADNGANLRLRTPAEVGSAGFLSPDQLSAILRGPEQPET
jgi:hypothetical protein